MTVSTTSYLIQYAGTGSTTAFATGFEFIADSDLVVVLTDSSGVDTTQVLTTNYTVTGAGNDAGGTVTMLVAPASGETLTIYRSTALTQATDYTEGDPFPAETHEQALDKLTLIAQEVSGGQDRTLKFKETEDRSGGTKNSDVPSPVENKVLGWDADGNLTNITLGSVTYDISIAGGDAGKVVVVNSTEDGIEVGALPVSSAETADTLALRDANGRIKVADPSADQDAVSLAYLNAQAQYDVLSYATYNARPKASLDVSAQASAPLGLAIKPDGTEIYFCNAAANTVIQYTLSTAWDISTGTYTGSFNVNSQDTATAAVQFKSDGTKMYMLGQTNNSVFQYTLSTAWDVTSASYDSVSFDVSTELTSAENNLAFKPDGSIMYVTGIVTTGSAETVAEYALSTAWDLSTAAVTSTEDVSAGVDLTGGIAWNDDGTVMFLVSRNDDKVVYFEVSPAYDSDMSAYKSVYDLNTAQPGGTNGPSGLAFDSTGKYMYLSNISGGGSIEQWYCTDVFLQ